MSTEHPLLAALLLTATAAALPAQIFPPPPQPAGNLSTPQKELLGKALFWDEQLSSTRTVACGTCHRFDTGGSDPRTTAVHPGADGLFGTIDDVHGSIGVVQQDQNARYVAEPLFGVERQVTGRKAPSPINSGYVAEMFWDGRAGTTFRDPLSNQVVLATGGALESQAAGPPVNTAEMSHIGRTWADIAADLPPLTPLALAANVPAALQGFVAGQTYAQLFQQVYGSPGVTPQRVLFAIAAYQRSLISDQSPFDRALVNQYAFTLPEQLGRATFTALCSTCHTDVLPTVLGTGPTISDYRNIGVRPVAEDQGRFIVTQNPIDRGRFKVPGLRNVALRAPYFHTGSALTLFDVVDFYARGGDFHQNQDPLIFNIIGALSPSDRHHLVMFLNTLTDPRVRNQLPPFDRPTLWSEGTNVPSTFGVGTAGSGGLPPRASAWTPPFLGNARFTVGVDRTAPSAFAFVAWDLFASQTPTVVLGHNVYLAQTVLATAGVGLTQGTGAGGGYASLAMALPNDPAFAGVSLFGQWLMVDALGPVGFASSNAFGFTLF